MKPDHKDNSAVQDPMEQSPLLYMALSDMAQFEKEVRAISNEQAGQSRKKFTSQEA